jgi:hypothetical protein
MRKTELSRHDRERIAALRVLRALAIEARKQPKARDRRLTWGAGSHHGR